MGIGNKPEPMSISWFMSAKGCERCPLEFCFPDKHFLVISYLSSFDPNFLGHAKGFFVFPWFKFLGCFRNPWQDHSILCLPVGWMHRCLAHANELKGWHTRFSPWHAETQYQPSPKIWPFEGPWVGIAKKSHIYHKVLYIHIIHTAPTSFFWHTIHVWHHFLRLPSFTLKFTDLCHKDP